MQINLIVIRTDKPKELSGFYEQLGMRFDYHQHKNGPWHYSTEIGETVFEIYPLMRHQEAADKSLRLGFTVENLDELLASLKLKNIEITSEPQDSEWGRFAIIRDIDGRKIELTESFLKGEQKR